MEVVNGYPCKNCTDVELAKKGIDPARPKDGPNGVYAADKAKDSAKADKASRGVDDKGPDFGPAVTLSGAFANVQPTGQAEKTQPYKPGSISSISA
ncbi:MAG TPA: hypothetical protein VF495_08130 [Phenylobacterium sp.]|jgi:hypothetical protein